MSITDLHPLRWKQLTPPLLDGVITRKENESKPKYFCQSFCFCCTILSSMCCPANIAALSVSFEIHKLFRGILYGSDTITIYVFCNCLYQMVLGCLTSQWFICISFTFRQQNLEPFCINDIYRYLLSDRTDCHFTLQRNTSVMTYILAMEPLFPKLSAKL